MFVREMTRVLGGIETDAVIDMSIHSNRLGSIVVQSEWLRSTTGRVVAASGRMAVDSNITYRLDYVNGVFFFEIGDKFTISEAVARIIDFVFARKGVFVHDQVVTLAVKDVGGVDGSACLERARVLSLDREIEVTTKLVKAMKGILPSIRRRIAEYARLMGRLSKNPDPDERSRDYADLKRHYDAEVARFSRRSLETTLLKSRLRSLKRKRKNYAKR